MFDRLRRYFFVGVFAIAPFALTLYVLILLGGWFDRQFQPLIRVAIRPFYDGDLPGLGIILGILLILLVGFLAPSVLGKWTILLSEKVVERIPLAKVIYSATKQIFDAFGQNTAQKFSRVVMIPFPKEGSWAVAFVTQEVTTGWVPDHPETKLAVFVPTTPNPTSGYLMFVDEREAISLDVSIEEGLKLVISAGLAKPGYLEKLALKTATDNKDS